MAERNIKFCVKELQDCWEKCSKEYAKRYTKSPQPFLTCTYRSPEEQTELYAQGRTKPGKIVTQLKSGGKHNSNPAKAFDIAFKDSTGKLVWDSVNFSNFAKIVKELTPNIKWGGNWKSFKDLPHFEI